MPYRYSQADGQSPSYATEGCSTIQAIVYGLLYLNLVLVQKWVLP